MMKRESKEIVYALMNGSWNLEEYPVEESEIVKNEFAQGELCEMLYQDMTDAKLRLCQRLHTEEDEDLEIMVDCLTDIGRYLSMKMYDYGAYFASEK